MEVKRQTDEQTNTTIRQQTEKHIFMLEKEKYKRLTKEDDIIKEKYLIKK